MKKRDSWKKRGPKPPKGGRVRITVNLPRSLLAYVKQQEGSSLSNKINGLILRQADAAISYLSDQHR